MLSKLFIYSVILDREVEEWLVCMKWTKILKWGDVDYRGATACNKYW